jgi:hypothetical protein
MSFLVFHDPKTGLTTDIDGKPVRKWIGCSNNQYKSKFTLQTYDIPAERLMNQSPNSQNKQTKPKKKDLKCPGGPKKPYL